MLESPDRTPQDLKTIEDWVVERAYRSVPGVADDSGFGGTTMQYQVLLDPAEFTDITSPFRRSLPRSPPTTQTRAADSIRKEDSFTTFAASDWCATLDDIGNVVVGSNKGVPIRVRDIGDVTIGHAPATGRIRLSEER